ncbi:hypothetical protein [Streptomyces sp. NRRL B-24572]|uniref:hypothetical protein n=1 Tax=Streptomyces sp. NRRL B-24572 TaxID=1962156 RepID=UPI000A3A2342|nr:hypothetical protein [Streptomyces sp. NRRL B-24572]
MSERKNPRRSDEPLPREPEDQQATGKEIGDESEDPLAVPLPEEAGKGSPPDTDVAGTGPRGRVREGTVHPEHPAPEEPAD